MLDTSVFKRLAHNDTGKAAGHQGGIVIPKAIASFFPPLPGAGGPENPTVDKRMVADLFVDGVRVATVRTRYQHQTWGGTRSPERRLTDNLSPLRNAASAGDIAVFTKDLTDDGYMQVHLLRQGTEEHGLLLSRTGGKNWGPVDPDHPPVSVEQIAQAEEDLDEIADGPAEVMGPPRKTVESSAVRKARDRAFRRKVLEQYGNACAFTGRRFVSPISDAIVGLDAAHVVSVSANGTDHPANGLALTKDLHWAYDKGLVSVSSKRTILVPEIVAALPGNEFLRELNGKAIREAARASLRVPAEAFEWHRDTVLLR